MKTIEKTLELFTSAATTTAMTIPEPEIDRATTSTLRTEIAQLRLRILMINIQNGLHLGCSRLQWASIGH